MSRNNKTDRFEIEGGHRLKGEIVPQGAKNEALQVISAVLLTSEPVIIHNIPDIVDVNNLIDLLRELGVEIHKIREGSYSLGPVGSTSIIWKVRPSAPGEVA